jgi:tRNA-2-methylthio-N6-dimethylallyladenosine synthase
MTPEMARRLGRLTKLCPYIHLPVQSGSDRVLEAMRRGYTAAQYEETIAGLRAAIPGLALTSDVIVGYPGESEADFDATLALVERARLDGLFVFTYSPRPGTTALRLADDVAASEKQRRLQALNDYQQRFQAERNQALVGSTCEVLVESVSKDGRLMGRTPQFRIVHFEGDARLLGSFVRVEVTATGPNALQGSLSQAIH